MRTSILFSIVSLILLLCFVSAIAGSDQLYPLSPKKVSKFDRNQPGGNILNDPLDVIYPIQHVDDNAEYYLGSGADDDTFFVVFEPPAACSVKFVEMQWFDYGNVTAFAAWYSDAATAMFPEGQAPNRGTSPVSPVGSWIAGPVPNSAQGTGNWEPFDLGGAEFIVGNPLNPSETDMFGVGFIKQQAEPHPLADCMNAKGIRFTYTWFGGPWMALMEHDWGAYSGNIQTGTVIDIMMRVWVSYPWGMPILISNLSQHCNTFDIPGPYNITCELVDDGIGITGDDTILLKYYVDGGDTFDVPLTETTPGSGIYEADIPGQPVGSQIVYWVFTIDDDGLENSSIPKAFYTLEPEHPDADLLFITDNAADRVSAYLNFLDDNGFYYEHWDATSNMGIDNSVINWGWSNIILAGWGVSVIPAEDEDTPFADFLDNGGNLCYIDQDYFYANGLPYTGNFASGDFAYDYFGINQYWNDPYIGGVSSADVIYFGESGDPVSGSFIDPNYYETYWDTSGIHMEPNQLWADYITVGMADDIFYGINDAFTYGCRKESSFKTVFLAFMAEASCEYINYEWIPSADFTTLMLNILEWFEPSEEEPWSAQITVTGDSTIGAPYWWVNTIGIDSTSAFFPSAPPPPSYAVYTQLYDPYWNGPYWTMIYQFSGETLTWIMEIDPNGNVIPPISRTAVVTWNIGDLPAGGELYIEDLSGNIIVPDMRTTASFTTSGTENQYFNIVRVPSTGAAHFSITPGSYDFGSLFPGQSSDPVIFTITNDGTETGSGTISLDNTNDFIADLPLPYDFILQPDESLEISVTFISLMPSGEKTGELLVDGDAPANNVSASLQGYTLSAGGDWSAELTITGETGSAPNIFNVTIGAMEESSFIPAPPPPPQYLTWPGLYDINWGGPYFELIYEFVYDTLTWILEIDPNGNVMPPISRTSVVSWDNAGLPASGELYIEDYFTGSVIVPDMRTATNFSLTGTENKYFNIINIPGAPPVFPEIELSAEELDFGSVAVGNDADLPLTIYSVGDTTLQIISVISNDPAFTVDFTPIGIEPGDSLVLIVSFSPPDTAVYESILSIINNAQTQEVDLYGEGYSGLFVGVTPVNPPIIIPASGGTFEFILSGDNATGQAQTVDIWTEVALPQVGTVGPLLLVENFTLSPFQSVSRNRFQAVPASAPGGTYTYYAYLGEYPWVIDIYDTFIFIKAGSDGGDYLGSVEDWRCSGEDFDMISAVVEIPSETALHSPYPNPFNPSTIISFELRDASEVSLIVYDIQGREVQSLVTGHLSLGYHEAVWNAEDFASGIYFVRLQAGDFMQTRKLLLIK